MFLLRLIRSTLFFALCCPWSPTAIADPVPSAQDHSLVGTESLRNFDGASATLITFRTSMGTFRYTPPAGWKFSAGTEHTKLAKGSVKANLSITSLDAEKNTGTGLVTPEQLNQFAKETIASVGDVKFDRVDEPTVLPFKIGNHDAMEVTLTYWRNGTVNRMTRTKTWGGNWQVQLDIEGSQVEFQEARTVLLGSLCSIESLTEQDLEREAAAREKEALSRIAVNANPQTPQGAGGKVRGRLP